MVSIFFEISRYNIEQDIKELIEENNYEQLLTIIAIPFDDVDNINWKEEDEEFELNGEMFDIVKSEVKYDTIYYHCINDKKEKKLISEFENYTKKGSRYKNKNLVKVFQKLFFKEIEPISILPQITFYFHPPNHFFPKSEIDVKLPPPKVS